MEWLAGIRGRWPFVDDGKLDCQLLLTAFWGWLSTPPALARHAVSAASGSDRGSQFSEQAIGFGPIDAAVRDALAVGEFAAGDELLRSCDKIALAQIGRASCRERV